MLKLIPAFLAALFAASPALAWDKIGHRVSAALAGPYLSDAAKAGVEAILGPEGLAEASNWPDFMRSSPEEFWRKEAGPYHYVTIPVGMKYRDVGAPEVGDAITALAGFTATLKDPDAALEDKQLALRFVVHIVSDLHQPLHAGNGTDRGGNDFAVLYHEELTNLHAVWDIHMIDRQKLSYTEWTEWLSQKITDQDVQAWWETDPAVWADESAAIRDTIYPENQIIAWDYTFAHLGTVKTRLKMAGVRTAAYLNEVFAD